MRSNDESRIQQRRHQTEEQEEENEEEEDEEEKEEEEKNKKNDDNNNNISKNSKEQIQTETRFFLCSLGGRRCALPPMPPTSLRKFIWGNV